jgi:hypothetical protein
MFGQERREICGSPLAQWVEGIVGVLYKHHNGLSINGSAVLAAARCPKIQKNDKFFTPRGAKAHLPSELWC